MRLFISTLLMICRLVHYGYRNKRLLKVFAVQDLNGSYIYILDEIEIWGLNITEIHIS